MKKYQELNATMILLDLFSGMGGFHLGLEQAGFKFEKVYFSEIDKHAIANYKYNFPNATHIGSVTDILNAGIERPDIITFGSPCQDFSLAGKRKGLGGTKSSLIEQAIAAVSHFRPDIFIWENVKGTFSSNAGSDFCAIIQAFANIGGYEIQWQLVNTAWLLPQNRERIYLIGHLAGSVRDWRAVFPIGENDEVTQQKEQSKRQQFQTQISSTIRTGYGTKGNETYIVSRGHGFVEDATHDICPTIRNSSFEHNTAVVQINPSTQSGGKQSYQHNRMYSTSGLSPCLDVDARSPIIPQHNNIRRLTEIECERLQGFPDNWTRYGNYDGVVKEISKTQRYKLCGNAVTAKMVQLIASRISKPTKTK